MGINLFLLPNKSNGGTNRGSRILLKMPLHSKVNRQNHGDDGYSAKHQNRKENFDYHRESGYQNEA